MRFGIAARLGIVLALSGMLSAGITAFQAQRASETVLVDSARTELLTSTRVLAQRITQVREDISRTLLALARHPAALAALESDDPQAATQLATLLALPMAANRAYFQLRLIGAADHGLERVRIDRDGDTLLRVDGDALQEKGHYPYVFDALALAAGEVYMSRVSINRERGSHAALGRPAVQLATPVVDESGRPRGVIVGSIDLNGVFALLAADLPADFLLYLANSAGDYLIHPDPARTFGFDKGRRVRVQDEFPATQAVIDGRSSESMIDSDAGEHAQAPLVAAFIAARVQLRTEEGAFILGLARPRAAVLAELDPLRGIMLQIVIGMSLTGILLAAILARAITHPIEVLGAAVQNFYDNGQAPALPVERQDEIGALARRFAELRTQIGQQLAELEHRRRELEHLARHDALTGLPNRALFDDRMAVALASARRDDGGLALLFVDIDDFKPINDRLGHVVGDRVLEGVAA
ncbi:diguanylate cyclase domain-containing protein, partial [Thauera aminoaromatica]|uniref:diguanylate cyclase domain-containing protein n=1 Tax=Thauera aminoaromatica TaxID=164330 RepID=UPI0035B1F35C